MKKILYFALPLLLLGACKNDEDNVFNASPAERINIAISNYDKILTSSEKGWFLEYYPSEKKEHGVYNAILKFKDGKVEAFFDGNPTPSTSLYSLKMNSGVELAFDTHNQAFMETFATPSLVAYRGLGGDVQYTIMNYENDVFTLMGKTSRNEVKMTRFTGDAAEFMEKVGKINKALIQDNVLNIEDKKFPVRIVGHRITFTNEEGGTEAVNFIPTETGFRLEKSVVVNGVTFSSFVLQDDEVTFLAQEKYSLKPVVMPIDFEDTTWATAPNFMSDELKEIFTTYIEKSKTQIVAGPNVPLPLGDIIYFGNYFGRNKNIYGRVRFSIGDYNLGFNIEFKGDFNDETFFNMTDLGNGRNRGVSGLEYIEPFVRTLVSNAPYKVQNTGSDGQLLISTKNPNIWFTLLKLQL